MAWYESAGQRIYYEDTGRGDTVVLLPGWGGSITELNPLRRELADGFRVIAGHDVHQSHRRWLASAVVGWLSQH